MSALKKLSTAPICLLFALSLGACVHSSVFNDCLTKTALLHVLFLLILGAIFPDVIGLGFASNTEVITAFIASYAVRAHVLRSCFIDVLALIIFIVIVDITLHEFDCVATFAADYAVLLVE